MAKIDLRPVAVKVGEAIKSIGDAVGSIKNDKRGAPKNK